MVLFASLWAIERAQDNELPPKVCGTNFIVQSNRMTSNTAALDGVIRITLWTLTEQKHYTLWGPQWSALFDQRLTDAPICCLPDCAFDVADRMPVFCVLYRANPNINKEKRL